MHGPGGSKGEPLDPLAQAAVGARSSPPDATLPEKGQERAPCAPDEGRVHRGRG